MISDIIAPPGGAQIGGIMRTAANGLKAKTVQSTISSPPAVKRQSMTMGASHGTFGAVEHNIVSPLKLPKVSEVFEAVTKSKPGSNIIKQATKPQQESKILQAVTKQESTLQQTARATEKPHNVQIRTGLPKEFENVNIDLLHEMLRTYLNY